MAAFDPDDCPDGWPHDWQRDPAHRGEGLVCRRCLLSEAELHGDDREEREHA